MAVGSRSAGPAFQRPCGQVTSALSTLGRSFFSESKSGSSTRSLYSIEWNSVNEVPSYYLYGIFDGTNGNAQLYGTPGYNAGNFNITYCNCCGNGTPWGGIFAWVALQSLATEAQSREPFIQVPSVHKVLPLR